MIKGLTALTKIAAGLLISSAALADQSVFCTVQKIQPNGLMPVIFSGNVESSKTLFIKPNGQIAQLDITTAQSSELLSLNGSTSVTASLNGDVLSVMVGTWSAQPSLQTSINSVFSSGKKAEYVSVQSDSRSLSVICENHPITGL